MGKPKHSDDPRGEQKGAQKHAEGQHGPKAFEARKAEINDHGRERDTHSQRAANDPQLHGHSEADLHERLMENPGLNRDGGHRLVENRVQHDEAEKNSEKNRRIIDVQRHHHDPEGFQIPGGRDTHPALPQDGPERTVKSTGHAGGNRSSEDRGG